MRIAIRYARSGPARYISHLDMQRAFGRVIRRARIPALYSQGFNPHLLMSFASPLSVGYATRSDYLELQVEDGMDLEAAFAALQTVCPPGICIIGIYEVAAGSKKLMALNDSASYEIRFSCESAFAVERLEYAAAQLSQEDSHVCTDRKGRELDLIPLIHDMTFADGTLRLRLANSSAQSLNPTSVAQELLGIAGLEQLPYEICRMECFARGDDRPVPFCTMFGKGVSAQGRVWNEN